MKKITFFIIVLVVNSTALLSQNWVNFSSSVPSTPEVNLLISNTNTVTFEITIPGIYTQDTVVNGMAFTRLILPSGEAVNPTGSPEIPVLKYQVAIPNCDGVEVEYQIDSKQNMNSCWVYPVPEIILNGDSMLVEQFAFNPTAYTLPRSNDPTATISSSGSLRSQKYVEVIINPVEFCPVTRQLSIIDKIVVTLLTNNPQGEIRQNVGIFNKVAATAFINYEDNGISALVNDKAFEKKEFIPGNVQWINLTDTAMASQIACDYLIITDSTFFKPLNSNSQLARLANHRAYYNGFDVAIVNVEKILSLNFYYEDTNIPPIYMKEQKIRTFIRRVYEGKNAQHTGDGCLAYVLLLGDNYTGNTGMPMSKDHNAEAPSSQGIYPSDYYFSCVTRDIAGKYDDVGDLYIGRLSVMNDAHLYNMVQKTINHETEYSPKSWRKKAEFIEGPLFPPLEHVLFLSWLSEVFYMTKWSYSTVLGYIWDSNQIRDSTLKHLNEGVVFAQYHAHGYYNAWSGNIFINDFYENLNNHYKAPFINTISCQTGWFDNRECLGEFLTRYDSAKGAVGYIGASRNVWISSPYNNPNYYDYYSYQQCYPKFLFRQYISIAGELMLKSKLHAQSLQINNKYGFNLFGDPALNILAEGYEITRNVTAECPAEITSKVIIRDGATLTVPSNCELTFLSQGQVIIEEGGVLDIKSFAKVYGQLCEKHPVIHVKGGNFEVSSGVEFHNLDTILLENNKNINGVPLYDGSKLYNLQNISFYDTPLIHRGSRLNMSNCLLVENSDVKTSVSISEIDSCIFIDSNFSADNSDFPVYTNISPYTNVGDCQFNGKNITNTAIQLNGSERFHIYKNVVSGYNSGISLTGSGITLAHTNGFSPSGLIRENKISNCDMGIELYNSASAIVVNNIYNNVFGVKLYNNSYTSFESYPIAPQIIRDCSSIELYATPCSCPGNLRYNKIIDEDNLGNSYMDPLFCVDIDFCCVRIRDISLNYWGENFNHSEDIYPPGAFYTTPVWEPGKSGAPPHGDDEDLYLAGLDYFANADYPNAESTFKELIQTYPDSHFAIAALRELFALEHYTNRDFYALISYYTTFTPLDSNLFNTADFLATRCFVKERDRQSAVDWYENRIENPPSYQDSIFAVIDLGDIHLMMKEDSIGNNGAKGCSALFYRLADIMPGSKKEYEMNKASLLATLPQTKKQHTDKPQRPFVQTDKKGTLGQCIPNPTNGNTTITYEIYVEGDTEIHIYNISGQLLKILPQGKLKTGYYQTRINVLGLPIGMYHYSLLINGEREDTKKMIVN